MGKTRPTSQSTFARTTSKNHVPIGTFGKPEVRKLAEEAGSCDCQIKIDVICFIENFKTSFLHHPRQPSLCAYDSWTVAIWVSMQDHVLYDWSAWEDFGIGGQHGGDTPSWFVVGKILPSRSSFTAYMIGGSGRVAPEASQVHFTVTCQRIYL